MLLIFFWIIFLLYNITYLFSVSLLAFLVIFLMLFIFSSFLYLKYLVVLIYLSGIIVFILYISCLCWYTQMSLNIVFFLFGFFFMVIFNNGMFSYFSDVGSGLWMYLFFSLLFGSLVNMYSLNLFLVSGSLRF